jgi:hypothetical protein
VERPGIFQLKTAAIMATQAQKRKQLEETAIRLAGLRADVSNVPLTDVMDLMIRDMDDEIRALNQRLDRLMERMARRRVEEQI